MKPFAMQRHSCIVHSIETAHTNYSIQWRNWMFVCVCVLCICDEAGMRATELKRGRQLEVFKQHTTTN